MKRSMSILLVVVFALAGRFQCPTAGAETSRQDVAPITTGSLMQEMADFEHLSYLPAPDYKTVQFSSYDRRSDLPGAENWFSNSDGFGGEPIPAFAEILKEAGADGIGEYLICDVQGAGAIVRVWTAAINGRIEMYLDDEAEPTFAGSADDFLRRPFNKLGESVGLDPTIFDGSFNQQNAAYCPIPFAKRCRIVWIGNKEQVHFYEVQVRQYEPGTRVVTFKPEDLGTYAKSIEWMAACLKNPGEVLRVPELGMIAHTIATSVPGGEARDLLTLDDGPGMIAELTLQTEAEDLDLALRQAVLHIYFDGAPHGQVEAPLGDFFGAGPGVNPFDSVPFTVELDGSMTCRFIMPYARSVRLRIENLGEQEVRVHGRALRRDYDWDDERSLHFRARWRVDHEMIADPAAPHDVPFLLANGAGRYVGTTSIMLNPTDVPTPAGGWWGEGDEKIFVDDDGTTPSTYGTGSEDYYNYAWSIPDIFGWAYCGQPRNDGPGNRGFVTNQRWHILDDLPFRERIAFYMELWPHKRVPGYSYARIGYHYARPGTFDDHLPITIDDVRPLELPANWQPLAWWGAGNSVFLDPAETFVRGRNDAVRYSIVEDNLFSDGRLFRWHPSRISEILTFDFEIKELGVYSTDLCALKDGNSGRIRFWVDDLTGEGEMTEVDLNAPGRTILRRIAGRRGELAAGKHQLHVEFLQDAKGPEDTTVGIDYLWIQKR